MLTIKDILTGRITLDIECVDRVYLNGYVNNLQMAGGLITFIRGNCSPHSRWREKSGNRLFSRGGLAVTLIFRAPGRTGDRQLPGQEN